MNIHAIYARISPRFRQRRLRKFFALIRPQPAERLLDVGGYPWCWPPAMRRAQITLLNLAFSPEVETAAAGAFDLITGDGCALPLADAAYDIVFSNSVIEHVGTWERQQRFAAEVRRVGRRLWVQTPAREFFVEPHLLAPFVHWLPRSWQRRLLRYGTLWGWLTRPDRTQVDAFLAEVRLLTLREVRELFPDCTILRERFIGLTKSYIAVRLVPP
jgi:hypothetical protein